MEMPFYSLLNIDSQALQLYFLVNSRHYRVLPVWHSNCFIVFKCGKTQRILRRINKTNLRRFGKKMQMTGAVGVREDVDGRNIMERAIEEKVWGIASAIDIYNCNPVKIRDAEVIRRFVVELCDLIEMKRFGETQVVHFGEDERVAGYSMVQLIETSLISAHFANQTNAVYLDVFSCKPYDPEKVELFAREYFEGSHCNLSVTLRS